MVKCGLFARENPFRAKNPLEHLEEKTRIAKWSYKYTVYRGISLLYAHKANYKTHWR